MRDRRPATGSAIPEVLATLKRQYKARNIRYREIATALEISEITVKRHLAGRGLTLEALERLCAVLDCSLFDIVDMAREKSNRIDAAFD